MDRIGKTVNAPRRLVAWVCLFLMLGPMGAACGQKSPEVERKGYTVRFDCRGGEPEIPPRVVYGPFGSPDVCPTKEGCLFVCWETEDGEPYRFGYAIDADITLYARWAETVAVTLKDNRDPGESREMQVVRGERMPEPEWIPASPAGCTFGGWHVDPACTAPFDFDQPVTGPLTLYASYSRDICLIDQGMVARVTGRSLEEERHLPNPNQTDVRWGLGGTDLGIIWEIAPGRYGLFFGDSYGPDFVPVAGGGPGPAGDWRSNVLAYSEDSDLSDGLTFSGMAADPNNAGRAREIIPRENYRLFTSIPTAAIALDGVQYVHYMYWQGGTDFDPLNYSSIYRSLDDGATWESCRDRIEFDEDSNFGMVGYATREGDPYCYMVGTHIGRSRSAYLARFRYGDILDRSAYEYWNGTTRRWVQGDEHEATVVLNGTVGELSVMWLEKYQRWIVLYFDQEKYAICYRSAARINGEWSEERILVSGADYPQLYGSYIHPASADSDELYYTMSEWVPYNVYLMRTSIRCLED